MIPYQNVLWLSNAVLQASIVILTVVVAFIIFFLTFTWSHLQKAKELERKGLNALNDGKLVVRRLIQTYRPEIVRIYESWFNEEPEAIEKVIGELSLHQVICRINARQRLLLFFFDPRALAEFLRVSALGIGLGIFVLYIKHKWSHLRALWITFCILAGMPIDVFRTDRLSFPLISPVLFLFVLFKSSPVVKAFKERGISELKIEAFGSFKLKSIKFKGSDVQTDRKYLKPEIIQWAVLHELSKWFSSELVFPLQLDFAKQFVTSSPPVSFYPSIERDLFKKAKERNMPEKFTKELRTLSKKCSDDSKKKLEGIIARIDKYRSQTSRFSMFLKRPGRILLKVVVGLLIVLCAAAAMLSLFAISGASSADLISKNLAQIAMGFLISAIIGLSIVVALLLKSF